jgi:hypothetical protein
MCRYLVTSNSVESRSAFDDLLIQVLDTGTFALIGIAYSSEIYELTLAQSNLGSRYGGPDQT